MAAYAGTITVRWDSPFGNKRVALLDVKITNYNSSGIPLTPHQAGLAYIEFLTGGVDNLDDSNAPVGYVYDPINKVCQLYKGANQQVANDVNLFSILGNVHLLVIGS